jgi:DNA helicase-2/ATP-dependent DNA helicase PcrA
VDLNEAQRQVVSHGEGACLVSAGPGSGKTETVSQRYVRLLQDGIRPERVLFVTFTNKAAREMRSRVKRKVGTIGERTLWIGTFHGMCVRLLKRLSAEVLDGRTTDFGIYSQAQSTTLIKHAMDEVPEARPDKDSQRKREGGPRGFYEWIEGQKRAARHPADFEPSDERDVVRQRVWELYEEKLRAANAFDFTDLLRLTTLIAESATPSGQRLRGMFEYVMVDEYQDTNMLQFRMTEALGQTGNILVVGDVDQSIYAFRGAQPTNIDEFQRAHPGCRVIRLETNYRSTKAIVAFCNSLISANTMRDAKTMHTDNEQGELPTVLQFDSGESEADDVARRVNQLIINGTPPGEIGIIYRQHRLSRSIEGALRDLGVDYVMARGHKFYDRPEVKDLLAYLGLIVHPESTVDFRRVACMLEGVGDGTVNKLIAYAMARKISISDAAVQLGQEAKGGSERNRRIVALGEFLAEQRQRLGVTTNLADFCAHVLTHSGLLGRYQSLRDAKKGTDEEQLAQDKVDNLKEVIAAVRAYVDRTRRAEERPSLPGYLESVALMTEGDEAEGDMVTLLTIHAAKGLQFLHGFVLGVDQGICPPDKPLELAEREEERRCLYVAASRCKRTLTLSTAAWRYLYKQAQQYEPSEFLLGIDEELFRFEHLRPWGPGPRAGAKLERRVGGW